MGGEEPLVVALLPQCEGVVRLCVEALLVGLVLQDALKSYPHPPQHPNLLNQRDVLLPHWHRRCQPNRRLPFQQLLLPPHRRPLRPPLKCHPNHPSPPFRRKHQPSLPLPCPPSPLPRCQRSPAPCPNPPP